MGRRFEHVGQEWEVVSTGMRHGMGSVGSGNQLPEANRWSVIFRSITKPDQGDYRASISNADVAGVSDEELKRILEEQLVIGAIDRSRYTWRPAEAIAKDTGVGIVTVQHVLENTPDVMIGSRNAQGLTLYTTRNHFVKTTGDVARRFLDVEPSS